MTASCVPSSSALRPIRCANTALASSADCAMTTELGACFWYSASQGGQDAPSSRTTTESSASSACCIVFPPRRLASARLQTLPDARIGPFSVPIQNSDPKDKVPTCHERCLQNSESVNCQSTLPVG